MLINRNTNITDNEVTSEKINDVENYFIVDVLGPLTEDERDIYVQNSNKFKVYEDGSIERFDPSEDLINKERYLRRIRRHRAQALKLYDVYETKILRGKQEEDPEVEEWYQWALDLPDTYDNNLPYHSQIRALPETLKKYR